MRLSVVKPPPFTIVRARLRRSGLSTCRRPRRRRWLRADRSVVPVRPTGRSAGSGAAQPPSIRGGLMTTHQLHSCAGPQGRAAPSVGRFPQEPGGQASGTHQW